MYKEIFEELNVVEKVLFVLLKKYSIKIYKMGVKKGYNWCN